MTNSLNEVLFSIMNLRRWNTMPQIDPWTEAENIAYYTHLAYAIARDSLKLTNVEMEILLKRCLLKSINKHKLSDISIKSRDTMREIDSEKWVKLIDETAKEISSYFPRIISENILTFLTFNGNYKTKDKETKKLIEDLIKFCQYKAAQEECQTNMLVYGKNSNYKKIKDDLEQKITKNISSSNRGIFQKSYDNLHKIGYLETIKQLKYLRRWNKVIRSNESTVMGHTFVVSFLTIVFASIEKEKQINLEFTYQSILKALFHDVPESLTGDVITPVKNVINKENPNFWAKVENKLVIDFTNVMPKKIKKELSELSLLNDFNDKLYSRDSLVKACDQLALILECVFEKEWGSNIKEMENAYERYTTKLQNSEWISIREYAQNLLMDFPK